MPGTYELAVLAVARLPHDLRSTVLAHVMPCGDAAIVLTRHHHRLPQLVPNDVASRFRKVRRWKNGKPVAMKDPFQFALVTRLVRVDLSIEYAGTYRILQLGFCSF